MAQVFGKIENTDTNLIIEKLRKITITEQPFIKPKGIFFLGKIECDNFKLITFDTPPVEVEFFVSSSIVKFSFNIENLSKSLTAIIYALGFPLVIGLLIWGMTTQEVGLTGKLFLLALLIAPVVINKIVKFFYETFLLTNIDDFLKTFEKLLDEKITRN